MKHLSIELITSNIELDSVVAQHLLLVPHPHAVLELEVERFQKLYVNKHSLLSSPLIQFTGGGHSGLSSSWNKKYLKYFLVSSAAYSLLACLLSVPSLTDTLCFVMLELQPSAWQT